MHVFDVKLKKNAKKRLFLKPFSRPGPGPENNALNIFPKSLFH